MNLTEEMLDLLIGHLPVGVQVLREDGLTMKVNDAFLRIFGCEHADQVVGVVNPLHEPSMRAQGITPYLERAFQGEAVQTPPAPFRSPLGPSRFLRSDILPIRDESGGVRRVVLLIEDLTERQLSAEALERRYRQIAVLQDALHRVAANLSTEGVLESILDVMRRMDQAEAAAIWLVDREGRTWNCVANEGLSAEYCADIKALYDLSPARDEMIGPIIRGNRPVVIEDTRSDPLNGSVRDVLLREGIGRLLAIPMRIGEDVVGSLTFYGREPGHFDALDVDTAVLLADQTAIALHNAELYERARAAAAEARVLNAMAAILTQTSGLADVLRAITETVAPLMGARRVAISRVDEEAGQTVLIAYTGMDAEDLARWGANEPRPLAGQHPAIRRMMETGEPLVLDEIGEDLLSALDSRQRAAVEAFDIRSLLLVPMVEDGRVVGTMSFDEPGEPRHWTAREVRLARGLAAQAAVAIRNARLMDEARVAREWLEDIVQARTEDLRAAHAEVIANEKLAAVGFMAREVAHGLRNPLNVISTSLYYLRSRFPEPDDRVERHFDTIARSVDQAANTITQLMNLAGSRQPEMAPIDLNQLAQRALQERFTLDEFRWVAQWDPDLPYARGDWTQISHAMKALVAFAAGAGGIIHIRTQRDGDKAVFAVGDDRPPLTDEDRAALFQPFFASATEWTGLGLSVARQIALKHEGDLTLEESDGLTWVRLSLPLATSDE